MNAMIVTFVAIGLTGIGAAMDTNVQYNGDGSYYCEYDAVGTGYIGIHTYTSDGVDHLMSGWTNTVAYGSQTMITDSDSTPFGDYSVTLIDRSATVGGADVGEDEAGYIRTIMTDNAANMVYTYANYHDDAGYGSHVTTDQTLVVGSLVDIGEDSYNVTGVVAETEISGYAYGSNTTVSGLVRTYTGDEYTYAYIQMDNGRMSIYALSAVVSVDPSVTVPYIRFSPLAQVGGNDIDGACGQLIYVDADGDGVFRVGAGTDMHGTDFLMIDALGTVYYYSQGTDVTMGMSTAFDGDFDAWGYVYAVDITDPVP